MDQQGLASDVLVQCQRRYRQMLDKTVTHSTVRWIFLVGLLVLFIVRIWLLQGWFIVTYGLGIFLLNLFIGFITPLVRAPPAPARPSTASVAIAHAHSRAVPNFAPPSAPTRPNQKSNPETDGPVLPSKSSEAEFKGFTRKLPEFKFWESAMKATLLAFVLTLTRFFDIPVFWPIRALTLTFASERPRRPPPLTHARIPLHNTLPSVVIYFIVLFSITMRERVAHMIKYRYLPCSWGKKKYAAKGPGAVKSGGDAQFRGKSSN